MPVQSKQEKVSNATSVVRGLRKHYLQRGKFHLDGVEVTAAELIAVYEQQLAALQAVTAARVVWQTALRRERALRRRARETTVKLKARVAFDLGVASFGEFGWTRPGRPGPKTAGVKLAGVDKRAARRAKQAKKKRAT